MKQAFIEQASLSVGVHCGEISLLYKNKQQVETMW